VGGIRSTGLTAATGIAEHVSNLFQTDICGEPNHNSGGALMGVSDSAACTLSSPAPVSTAVSAAECAGAPDEASLSSPKRKPFQFGTLAEMSQEYVNSVSKDKDNGSGNPAQGYLVLGGHQYRVTHPISSFGMENYEFISSIQEQRSED
jgi:hypothetical protein